MSDPVLTEARLVLQRVAAHVLARRRNEVTGRFGLRVSPGGLATPAFGPEPEVLRIAGTTLVREVGGRATTTPIPGSTLRALAVAAGSDIDAPFECGADTPPTGDVDAPLALDPGAAAQVAAWYALGQATLDEVIGALGPDAEPATLQVWPEHFDLGTNVGLPGGTRVNLGASPGDGAVDEPYLYVGPWDAARPGDPSYWDVPFGAALRRSQLPTGPVAAVEEAVSWARRGLELLGGASGSQASGS